MESILRAVAVYLFILLVFRLAGKRTLAESTPFDLVLLLIIGDTTQQAMVGDDHSLVNAQLLIVTLVLIDVGLSLLKRRSPRVARILDNLPLVIVRDGRPLTDRMSKERVDAEDVLEAARLGPGLERLDQIACAVLERNGRISIVPRRSAT